MGNIAKSWAIPKFDIKDPSLVLYAPLWRPDMVANGGAIVNGTGALPWSPYGLAVGANTVDIIGAGTFIVTMPEGGTVASGTMTVTGSTVTVLAGIATTITTTGAIGNITVTPSNIIRSKDTNNHSLTIVGTTWGNIGRTSDGDDYIDCGAGASLDITGNLTIEAWINRSGTSGGTQSIIRKATQATSKGYQLAELNTKVAEMVIGDGTEFVASATVALTDGIWTHAAGVYNGIITMYKNGVQSGTPSAAQDAPATNAAEKLYIGCADGSSQLWLGSIGEVRIYNRALSVGEVMRNYQATKWRYQ